MKREGVDFCIWFVAVSAFWEEGVEAGAAGDCACRGVSSLRGSQQKSRQRMENDWTYPAPLLSQFYSVPPTFRAGLFFLLHPLWKYPQTGTGKSASLMP